MPKPRKSRWTMIVHHRRIRLPEPSFTSFERQWAIMVLENAKKRLYTGYEDTGLKHRMICIAVERAGRYLDDNAFGSAVFRQTAEKINQLIRARLGGAPTLRHWLADRGYPVYASDSEDLLVFRKVQDARHRWVDALIEEMKSERIASGKKLRDPKRKSRRDSAL